MVLRHRKHYNWVETSLSTLENSSGQSKKIPPGQFFARRWAIYAALGLPKVDIERWRLKVSGLVQNPLEFTYTELMNTSNARIVRDFHCVTKWSISDVVWEGVPFRTIASSAGVKPEAEWVMFHCLEGYTTVVPVQDVMVEDSIIALKMNGKPLSIEQGFPARPFMPQLYGWKSAKWLNEIEFIKDYVDGYWEQFGYHERGDIWEEERFKGHSGKHMPRRGLGTHPIS